MQNNNNSLQLIKEKIIKTDEVLKILQSKNQEVVKINVKYNALLKKYTEKCKSQEKSAETSQQAAFDFNVIANKYSNLEGDYKKLQLNYEQLEATCSRYKRTLDGQSKEVQQKAVLVKRNSEQLTTEIGKMRETSSKFQSRLDSLQQKLRKRNNLQKYREQIKSLEHKNSTLSDELFEIRLENAMYQERLQEQEETVSNCDSEDVCSILKDMMDVPRLLEPFEAENQFKTISVQTDLQSFDSNESSLPIKKGRKFNYSVTRKLFKFKQEKLSIFNALRILKKSNLNVTISNGVIANAAPAYFMPMMYPPVYNRCADKPRPLEFRSEYIRCACTQCTPYYTYTAPRMCGSPDFLGFHEKKLKQEVDEDYESSKTTSIVRNVLNEVMPYIDEKFKHAPIRTTTELLSLEKSDLETMNQWETKSKSLRRKKSSSPLNFNKIQLPRVEKSTIHQPRADCEVDQKSKSKPMRKKKSRSPLNLKKIKLPRVEISTIQQPSPDCEMDQKSIDSGYVSQSVSENEVVMKRPKRISRTPQRRPKPAGFIPEEIAVQVETPPRRVSRRLQEQKSPEQIKIEEIIDNRKAAAAKLKGSLGRAPQEAISYKRPIRSKQIIDRPRSPSPISEIIPHVKPRIIPLEKSPPLSADVVEALFSKMLTYPTNGIVLEDMVCRFRSQEPQHIAECILNRVSVDTDEPDTKYTPPAPLLTETQRVFLGFMSRLDKINNCQFDCFLNLAEKRLLTGRRLLHISPLTRLYLAVCKLQRNIHRMRRMCCDSVYFMGQLAVPFLFIVFTSWSEVLPMAVDSAGCPVIRVIVQVIRQNTCDNPGYNLNNLKALLEGYYGYPKSEKSVDQLMADLVQEFAEKQSEMLEYSILILCKNQIMKWTCQQIEKHFKPLIIQKNLKLECAVIKIIGKLVTKCKLHTTNIKIWLKQLLTECSSADLRECIEFSLERLR